MISLGFDGEGLDLNVDNERFSSLELRWWLLFNDDNEDSSSASFDEELELCRTFDVRRFNGRNVL